MFIAFMASGRLSVIVASPSLTSYSTVSAIAASLRVFASLTLPGFAGTPSMAEITHPVHVTCVKDKR
ncbi:hypothetical protein GCM10010272_28460 [Streptomyces lateritius]|nr:hypothetical protein GCM10010272_28460 [Streptomyces lateritius]